MRHMRKQLAILIFTVAACAGAVLLTCSVGHVEAQGYGNYPGGYELICPGNSTPLNSTYNPATSRYRAWQCIDGNGNVITALGPGSTVGGVAPATLPINLAGGSGVVTGTLPGGNYAAVNLAASGNGGVIGVLAPANEGTGTPSASNFLRGDGSWQTVAAGITEGVIEFNDNSTGNCATNGVLLQSTNGCAVRWFWANAHTITRFRMVLGSSAGCTTAPVVSVKDLTSSTVLTSLTQVNGTQTYDSGALSISTTAAHAFGLGLTTAGVGCTTTPDLIQADVTYQ